MLVRRIGAHTSTAGALENAAIHVHEYGGNCCQIFSGSPRTWTNPMPRPDAVQRLAEARTRLDVTPLAIHANYLINLASIDPANRDKSVEAFRGELARALAIGADYLVLHPGSFRNQTVDSAIGHFAKNLLAAAKGLRSDSLTILLENTAGAGSALGSRFEELAAMRELLEGSGGKGQGAELGFRTGYCLDTCHTLAAGYDVVSPQGLKDTLAAADEILGLENVPVIHVNDSKTPLGSRRDRHQHIGEGYIGLAAFGRILNHAKLRGKAFILETPVDDAGDYPRNIAVLKSLLARGR
jgi:deoxyribonuclease-4